MNNKKFLDNLDGGWSDVISNTYEDSSKEYKISIGFRDPLIYTSSDGKVYKNIKGLEIFFYTEPDTLETRVKEGTLYFFTTAKIFFYIINDGENEYKFNCEEGDDSFNIEYYFSDVFGVDLNVNRLNINKFFDYNLNSPNSKTVNKNLYDLIVDSLDADVNKNNLQSYNINIIVNDSKRELLKHLE